MKQTIQIFTSEKSTKSFTNLNRSTLRVSSSQLCERPGESKDYGDMVMFQQFGKQHLGDLIKVSFVLKQILVNCS